MNDILNSFCRLCTAACPTLVEMDEGQPVRVSGDRSSSIYGGYTCVKGRGLPKIHLNSDRLLYSLKKDATGRQHRIATDDAITEIADKLRSLVEEHGPRSVACYFGNAVVLYPMAANVGWMWMSAINSPMIFDPGTIDQPGISVANALHGEWLGGRIAAADSDVALVVGTNPIISHQYFSQNPARQLKEHTNGGMKLIVIDPRRTESARRAHVHLQPHPGEDVTIVAGLLNLLISGDWIDRDFLTANVDGLATLTDMVAPFTPEYVARRAGIDERDLRESARLLGQARKGHIAGGTGIGMTGHGNLAFYLLLCLQSVRGFWPRAGEKFAASAVLLPKTAPKAQARGPYSPVSGDPLRVRGLRRSVAGMPTSCLPDEILTPGEGQVRALICIANPLSTWPNAARTHEALSKLELLVVPNVELSETARLAHYVLATKQILETPSTTQFLEVVRRSIHPGYGLDVPYAQYTPALLDPPAASDLIEEWQMFYRIAQRMGSPLQLRRSGEHVPQFNEEDEPTSDEVLDFLCQNSAVPLSEVRNTVGGRIYPAAQQYVGPKDPDCPDRLNIADPIMMNELAEIVAETIQDTDRAYPYRLITRRSDGTFNSMHRRVTGYHKRRFNPAFMSPGDLEHLGLATGDLVSIRSEFGEVTAIVDSDDTLRPGVLSISHGYGAGPEEPDDPSLFGSNVNRLLRMESDDTITGMPRMGAVPVAIARLAP